MPRAVLATLLVALYTTALGVPCFFAGLLERRGRWAHACIRLWGRLIAASFGVRVRVEGEANVPAGPAVYAANHVSAADIPIVFGFLPFEFRIIHKRSLSWVPILGWCLAVGGHIAIDRSNPFRARRSLERAVERHRGGVSVVVFHSASSALSSMSQIGRKSQMSCGGTERTSLSAFIEKNFFAA